MPDAKAVSALIKRVINFSSFMTIWLFLYFGVKQSHAKHEHA